MQDYEPLKKGQEVFLRRPMEIYATVIGPRDFRSPDGAEVYCVKLQPVTQCYLLEDLELSQKAELKATRRWDFLERAQEINGLISRRAYQLFENGGFTHGHDREDWIRAQSEILLSVPVDIRETETELTIRAEVPGFSEETLEVQVAPRSLGITGKRQKGSEQDGGNTVYSERRADQIFRVLDLPSQVDPDSTDLSLDGGILEIRVSKLRTGAGLAKSAVA